MESGALCRVTRFTVAAISIRSVSQRDRAVTLSPAFLHRLLGEAGLASGYRRVFLGLPWSSSDILVVHQALHTLFFSQVLCGTLLPNFH